MINAANVDFNGADSAFPRSSALFIKHVTSTC